MSLFLLLFSALITLFGNGQFDTTATGEGNRWFAMGADNLNVPDTGRESSVDDVTYMNDVITPD